MMATLSQQMAEDLAVFYGTSEHAVPATVVCGDGTEVLAAALVEAPEARAGVGAPPHNQEECVIRCRVSEVSAVAARDRIQAGGETWEVLSAARSADRLEWVLTCARDRRATFSGVR